MPRARVTLPVEGMTCGACATTVQKRLARAEGVADAAVNYATGKAWPLASRGCTMPPA